MLLKTQIFKRKGKISSEKIFFRSFFLILSNMTYFMGIFIRVQKDIWQLLWKFQDHFCNAEEVVEKTNFLKKGNLFSDERRLAYFFSSYWLWQTSGDDL